MKVGNNIKKLSVNTAMLRSINSGKNTKDHIGSNYRTSGNYPEALQKKRAFIEAIILTQIAQSFFQKASLLSTRLKNVASQGITSGKISSTEITEALSGIRTSLNDIREGFESTVSLPSQNFIKIYQFTGVQTDIPDIDEELDLLISVESDLSKVGFTSGLKSIDRINSSLINKESALKDSYKQLINENVFNYKLYNLADSDFPELSASTANRIVEHPQLSLGTQGNLSYETVLKILHN